MCMSNESRSGLYIDLLMTVRYSHEAWEGRTNTVASAGEDASVQLHKNDSVLMPKGEFKLASNPNPNPARLDSMLGRAARARVW